MTALRSAFVDQSRATLLLHPLGAPPGQVEAVEVVDAICVQCECVQLRPHQRVQLPSAEKIVVLREGMLAIDAMPAKGKLQILDFLMAGDVVSAFSVLPAPGISLRAITSASVVLLDPSTIDLTTNDYRTFVLAQCLNQLARINIHQLMIGRLETAERVASFLFSLALRNTTEHAPEATVALPMSRIDIANYLVINCDTLSRAMMRFTDCGLVERIGRHVIRITDLDALRSKSPLAPLISAIFEKGGGRRQRNYFGHYAKGNVSFSSDCEITGLNSR